MNIGILTYHAAYNFGANLQAYATVRILESLGHGAQIIDYGRLESQASYRNAVRVPEQQWLAHDRFINDRLPKSRHASDKRDLIEIVREEKFDGIVVGADAVWSYSRRSPEIPVFFMDWLFQTPDISEIPVAAVSVANMSGGFKHVSPDNLSVLRDCIGRFAFLSVRDNWTRELVNSHIYEGRQVVKAINPDPVFLLDGFIADHWDAGNLVEKHDKFILFTLPRNAHRYNNWLQRFISEAHELGYRVGELPLPEGTCGLPSDFTVPYPIDPVQWFLWLKNASGFIGLRYHAIVSCISVGTPFMSIDSYGRNNIVIRLLNKCGVYRLGRMWDHNSKIYQVLEDTPFRAHRVNDIGLLGVAPGRVLSLLHNADRSIIIALRNRLADVYMANMHAILSVMEKPKP